jgi:ribosomal protein L11 methyltransferase
MEGWKKNFKPIHVTDNFVIRPSWEDYQPQPDEIVIVVDPKMAFGTGHHETTAQCLKALEKLGCVGKRLLDYGCGTGILGIAAAKMGAAIVTAVDNDPEAIDAAKENAALNDIVLFVELAENYIAFPPAEIILANLITDQLIKLFDCLNKSLEPGGYIVFSGISVDDYPRFAEFIKDKPLSIEETFSGIEWITLICRKSN